MHVSQLEQFLIFIEQREAAAPPVRGRQRMFADGAALVFVPTLQQALEVLRRRIDLRQTLLIAVALLGPARARLQTVVLFAAQSGGEGKFVIEFDSLRLMVVGAYYRPASAIAEV